MATYGYKREDGTYFEVEQSMKEYVALTECRASPATVSMSRPQ